MDNKHGNTFYVCRKCSALFTDPEERTKHMAEHGIEEEETQLTCTKCNAKNPNDEALETHIREVSTTLGATFD